MTPVRAIAIAAVAVALASPAAALARCDAPADPRGEWTTYGADLSNTRTQPHESVIGRDTATSLAPAFVHQAPGTIYSTPIVAGGCVFLTSQTDVAQVASVEALDADSGTVLWSQKEIVGATSFGGSSVGSPALWGDLVIVPYNHKAGPYLVAYDRSTGAEAWRTKPLDTQPDSGVNSSPVVYHGLIFMGFFGNADAGTHERGGFVLVDADTGAIVKRTLVIPDSDFEKGFEGAGIWSTPAIDTASGYAYTGTSNPHNPHHEHERSDSIVKIDLDRDRSTFGQIVGSYKGVSDTVVPGASQQPACETKDDIYYAYAFSTTCLAVDLDFGASPNLFTVDGKTRVGELQKAGIYHVIDAGDMSGLSKTAVGPSCFACDAASSAFAGGHAYVAGGPPGEMVSIDATNGVPAWAAPIAGGLTYNPVSVANGMVWTVDSAGFLDGFDEQLGAPLVKRPMRLDTGVSMNQTDSSSGIAIAHNTLYTAAASYLIAYRVGA